MDNKGYRTVITVLYPLYQLCVILYRLFDALWLDTDIPLCGACAAMLLQPLNQRNIKAIGIINLRSIPFAEAVGTDALIAQIVAYNPKLALHCPFCDTPIC